MPNINKQGKAPSSVVLDLQGYILSAWASLRRKPGNIRPALRCIRPLATYIFSLHVSPVDAIAKTKNNPPCSSVEGKEKKKRPNKILEMYFMYVMRWKICRLTRCTLLLAFLNRKRGKKSVMGLMQGREYGHALGSFWSRSAGCKMVGVHYFSAKVAWCIGKSALAICWQYLFFFFCKFKSWQIFGCIVGFLVLCTIYYSFDR